MKTGKGILVGLFCLTLAFARGQVNNVLNFSFENYTGAGEFGTCYTGPSGVNNWFSPSAGTPDWLNPIQGPSGGMPQNYAGYQYARTGISYAGLGFAADPSLTYREYITGTFSDSLKGNKRYCVAFYVSLGDSIWWAVSAIGAYIFKDSICTTIYDTLPFIPQIENPYNNVLTDKIDWVPISGEFIANGGEKHITIGNFYSDSMSNFTYVGGGSSTWHQIFPDTYYYIDDVSVRELTIANAGKEDTICLGDSVLIGGDTITPGVSFHWQPMAGLSNPNVAQPKASPSVATVYTLTVVNDSVHGCNCADSVTKDSVTISVCTGINNLRHTRSKIQIEPNPNNGVFLISGLAGNMKIEIYDFMGKLINSNISKSSKEDFDISDKPNGVYLIRVTEDGWLVGQKKVIVNR